MNNDTGAAIDLAIQKSSQMDDAPLDFSMKAVKPEPIQHPPKPSPNTTKPVTPSVKVDAEFDEVSPPQIIPAAPSSSAAGLLPSTSAAAVAALAAGGAGAAMFPSAAAGIFPTGFPAVPNIAAAATSPAMATIFPWLQNQMATATGASTTKKGGAQKTLRPFKAYPREPLSFPLGYYSHLPGVLPTAATGAQDSSAQAAQNSASIVQQAAGATAAGLDPATTAMMAQMIQQAQKTAAASAAVASKQPSSSGRSSADSSSAASTEAKPTVNGAVEGILQSYAAATTDTKNASASVPSSPNSTQTPATTSSYPTRKRPRALPDDKKDEAYWERRRKNNDAAKRSRDARRAKEDEIAIRAAFLEQENLKLKYEIATMRQDMLKLRQLLIASGNNNIATTVSPSSSSPLSSPSDSNANNNTA